MNDVYLLFQSDPAKNQTFQEASSIQMPSTFYFTTKLSKINTFEFSFKGCNSNWERFVLKGSRQKNSTPSDRTGTNFCRLGNLRFYCCFGYCQPQLNLKWKERPNKGAAFVEGINSPPKATSVSRFDMMCHRVSDEPKYKEHRISLNPHSLHFQNIFWFVVSPRFFQCIFAMRTASIPITNDNLAF